MKKHILLLSLLFVTILVSSQEHKLWYSEPAKEWVEALPIGNGRLGGMIYGGVDKEEIQLNEETVWGGGPHSNNNPEALKTLPEVRRLIFYGENLKAQQLIDKTFRTPHNGMPYQTIGSLFLSFAGHDNFTDYYRDLSLSDAVSTTQYKVNGVTYIREVFSSLTDNVIVMKIAADKKNALNFKAFYNSPMKSVDVKKSGKKLILTGKGTDHEGIEGMIRFNNQALIKSTDGNVIVKDDCIEVENASEAIVYISAATNFVNYENVNGNEEKKATNILDASLKKTYRQLRSDHIAYYQKQYKRVDLSLGKSKGADKATNVRLKTFAADNDPGLATLLFNYGRYLLISSSQPGNQSANLQGIWKDKLLAPWDGKYTVNINLEMNYWPADVTNLMETNEPLFQMLKELSVTGAKTAREMYGAGGWVLHHNTDIWRSAGVVDGAFWGMWPNGGAWLTQHLWQHYLYSGNTIFLKEYYPVMKGTADFLLDFLVEHPLYGWMVTVPSNSPEQGPGTDNGKWSTIAGCTMDNQLAFDVLSNTWAAGKIIGADSDYQQKLLNMILRLAPMQIGQHNQLQEWLEDVDDPKNEHRHVSHLYGLYPSNQISPYTHPDLFQAAKKSLIYRGDMDIDGIEQNSRLEKQGGVVRLFVLPTSSSNKEVLEKKVKMRMAKITQDHLWLDKKPESVKTLILEHHMAAIRLGFSNLFQSLNTVEKYRTSLKDGTLSSLNFFTKNILPLIEAHKQGNKLQISRIITSKSYLLNTESLIQCEGSQIDLLKTVNNKVNSLFKLWEEGIPTLKEILLNIYGSNLFDIPSPLSQLASEIIFSSSEEEDDDTTSEDDIIIEAWKNALECSFNEIENYYTYISDESQFATHQGVKGLEFDRVIGILSDEEAQGFLFSYEKLFGVKELSSTDLSNIENNRDSSMERTKRLFYVVCSRAKESLALITYTENVEKLKKIVVNNGWFTEDEILSEKDL